MAEQLLRLTILKNPYIEQYGGNFPSIPQAYFLTAPVQEILYGGAAGGGKSAGILAAALQYVQHPSYSALILRRTYADLEKPGALIPLSKEWLASSDARYNGQEHRWTFPSGATVSFGHLQNEDAKYDYQGSAFAFIGFDELTQFTETMYRYMFSRLRKAVGLNFPVRIRATSNPGGVGHEWVRARFIDGANDRRMFIPAKLEDNPGLDKAAYEESLAELDHITRQQLRHGDWDIRPDGALFKREWFDKQFIDKAPPMVRVVRAWDLAATEAVGGNDPDFTAGVKIGDCGDGTFVVMDVEEFRATPASRNARIRSVAERDGRSVEVHIEQEPGSSGKSVIDQMQRDVLKGFSVYGVRSTGDKLTRAKPFSAACENKLVRIVRGPWVKNFIDRLLSFGIKGVHDDVPDATSTGFGVLTGGAQPWDVEAMQEKFSRFGEIDADNEDESESFSPMGRFRS